MIQQQQKRQFEEKTKTFKQLTPQERIYNRNFYLRNQRHKILEKEAQREVHELAEISKISPSSYVILVQKLQEKIDRLINQNINSRSNIQFSHFEAINRTLAQIQAISNEKSKQQFQIAITQMWLLLIKYDLKQNEVQQDKIQNLLHILYCPYVLRENQIVNLFKAIFPNLEQYRVRYIEDYPEESQQVLNIEGIVKMWLKVRRQSIPYHLSQNNKKVEPENNSKFTYKPQINPQSRELAEASIKKFLAKNKCSTILSENPQNQLSGYISNGGQEMSHHDILYMRRLEKDQFLKTNRQKVEIPQRQRVLSVMQTKQLVQNLYFKPEKKQDLDFKKIKEQEQIKFCTFKPNKTEYVKKDSKASVKGEEKQIERLQKGRKQKQKLQQIYDNLGRVKNTNAQTPSFIERDTHRLILQVNIGSRIQKIKLKGNQKPRLVAKKFVLKHNLEQSMQSVLQQLITQHMAQL